MGQFRANKVVSALPGTLDPDTLYLVRTGAGFDFYCSDATGGVAHKLNSSAGMDIELFTVQNARRLAPTTPVVIGTAIPDALAGTTWQAGHCRLYPTNGNIFTLQSDGTWITSNPMPDNCLRIVLNLYGSNGSSALPAGLYLFKKKGGVMDVLVGQGVNAQSVLHSGLTDVVPVATRLFNKADLVGATDIEVTDATKGVILRAPGGGRWRITVNDSGVLSGVSVP